MKLFRKLSKKKVINEEPKLFTGLTVRYTFPIDSYIKHALNNNIDFEYNDVEVSINKDGLFINLFVKLLKKGE